MRRVRHAQVPKKKPRVGVGGWEKKKRWVRDRGRRGSSAEKTTTCMHEVLRMMFGERERHSVCPTTVVVGTHMDMEVLRELLRALGRQ